MAYKVITPHFHQASSSQISFGYFIIKSFVGGVVAHLGGGRGGLLLRIPLRLIRVAEEQGANGPLAGAVGVKVRHGHRGEPLGHHDHDGQREEGVQAHPLEEAVDLRGEGRGGQDGYMTT